MNSKKLHWSPQLRLTYGFPYPALAVIAFGCAGAPQRPTLPRASSETQAARESIDDRTILETMIGVRLLQTKFGCASVRLRIGATHLSVCLDTGSFNILPSEAVSDGAHLDIGIQTPNDISIFTGVSEALTQGGVDGLLAPQSLAISGHYFAMDMSGGTVFQVADRDVAAVLGAYRDRALSEINVRRCDAIAGKPPFFVAEVTIGGQATLLLVDTGSTHTVLNADSPAATRLVKQVGSSPGGGYQRWNRTTQVRELDGEVPLQVGNAQQNIEPLIEHDPPATTTGCESQGALGLDFLRHCMLVTNGEHMYASCKGG